MGLPLPMGEGRLLPLQQPVRDLRPPPGFLEVGLDGRGVGGVAVIAGWRGSLLVEARRWLCVFRCTQNRFWHVGLVCTGGRCARGKR